MIAELDGCFEGNLAHWRGMLSLGPMEGAAMAGPRLLEREGASDVVGRFARTYPGADRRSVVSMWTQWYFGALVVPAAATLLVQDRILPVALSEVRVVFHEDGRPRALVLAHAGCPAGDAAPADRLSALIEGHAEPLIRHLAVLFRVSPKLLWCNLATILDWTLREIGPRAVPEARVAALARLGAPLCPNGRRNALAGAVRELRHADGPAPQRRVCCLRYLLPGVAGCGDLCPLPEISGRAPA